MSITHANVHHRSNDCRCSAAGALMISLVSLSLCVCVRAVALVCRPTAFLNLFDLSFFMSFCVCMAVCVRVCKFVYV